MKHDASCTIDKQNGKSYEWILSSSPRSKKFRVGRGKGKVMLEVLFFFTDRTLDILSPFLKEKLCPLTFFVALGMRSEGNARKNVEPTVNFSFTTMLQHTG
jgi:hypothetical protein